MQLFKKMKMKTIKQNIIRIMTLCIIIVGTMLFSCSDFLDVDEYFKHTTQLDSIFQRKELVDQYLRGAAGYLPNEGNLWTNASTPFQGASDENFTSFNDNRHAAIKFLLDEITPFSPYYDNYANYYAGIRKANIVLQRIGEVEDISDLDRRDFMGRCYFLRGYYYYQLLLQYGPVPIMPDEPLPVDASIEEMSRERATYDECVEYICQNMEQAAELLYSERPVEEISIPTKGAALAVVSRIRLYAASPWFNGGSGGLYADWTRESDGAHFISQNVNNEKWGKAAIAAKRVMDLDLYELYTTSKRSDTKSLPEIVKETYAQRPIPQFDPSNIDPFRSYAEVFNGAKLLYAYGEATVPKITVTLRKAYGGAHIVMSCKQLRGDINYAWPSAEIAVMGAEGAIEVLYSKEIAAEKDPEKRAAIIEEKKNEYNRLFTNPYNAARYGYIDDIIEPRNTRFRIIRALQQLQTKKLVNPPKKHDNLPL
jgi:hypothetical protein